MYNTQSRLAEGKQITMNLTLFFPIIRALTLHDVVMPAVSELAVISVLVEPPEEDLIGVTVFQVDQLSETREEGGVPVRTVLV